MLNKLRKITFAFLISLLLCLTACSDDEVKKDEDSEKHYYITPTPATKKADDGINTSLPVCDTELVRLLVGSYYAALKNNDMSRLSQLVSSPAALTEDIFKNYKNAESINVRHVYQLEGETPLDYIIYVYYELKFKDIDTPVPSLDELYVTKNGDGYSIANGTVSATAYGKVLDIAKNEQGVKELVDSVNRLFDKALQKDEALKAYLTGSSDSNSSLNSDNL